MLKRKAYTELLEWKKQRRTEQIKKCLLVKGARQVGKSFIVKEFGENEYDSFISMDFYRQKQLKQIFEGERNILIDEALYRRLNELHLSGKLGNVIHDIEGLKALLIEEDPGNDEKVEQYREQMTVHYDIKIGQFKFQDENIWYAVGSQSDITIKANHLVIKEEIRKKDHAGMVSYNLLNGIYEVQYDRLMSKDEQYAVMDGFSISENRVRFYVNSCLG